MTFQQLVEEVQGFGFDYEPTNRIEDWVQRSYKTLCSRQTWPFLEAEKEAVAPFELKDVRGVLSVTNTTNNTPLWGATRQWLAERYPELDEEAIPLWWFLDDLTLRVYPLSTSEKVKVRYVKKPEVLAAEDEPLVPEEWQDLIVDLAVIEGYKRNSNLGAASEMKELTDGTMLEMIADLMQRDLQAPQQLVRSGRPNDYL